MQLSCILVGPGNTVSKRFSDIAPKFGGGHNIATFSQLQRGSVGLGAWHCLPRLGLIDRFSGPLFFFLSLEISSSTLSTNILLYSAYYYVLLPSQLSFIGPSRPGCSHAPANGFSKDSIVTSSIIIAVHNACSNCWLWRLDSLHL